MDLFNSNQNKPSPADYESFKPLAERLRPQSLDDFAGQNHLVAKGKPIWNMIHFNKPVSIIFWGPPGVGKTTLAYIIANNLNAEFIQLSAVSSGVKEVRNAIQKAEFNLSTKNQRTILFIDEIHRFNKAQQDSLLHSVEKGVIILIGATTENPSFEVISPLLSRTQIYILEELNEQELKKLISNALHKDLILKNYNISIEDVKLLIRLSGGDARRLLNGLEIAFNSVKPSNKNEIFLSNEIVKEAFQNNFIKYDKSAEEHYNLISAFIKSVRGSSPDAAVYWLARMLKGGEDPKFIARRMIILASEDIGNADPYALTLAVSAFSAVNYIGIPESQLVLSQAAIYLAAAPKSNASYIAINEANNIIEQTGALSVPLHLRNAPTNLMKELNYGKDYKYPHDFDEHYTPQQYLPDEIKDKKFYKPSNIGKEAEIKIHLEQLKNKSKKS